jgi:hypothetical protein
VSLSMRPAATVYARLHQDGRVLCGVRGCGRALGMRFHEVGDEHRGLVYIPCAFSWQEGGYFKLSRRARERLREGRPAEAFATWPQGKHSAPRGVVLEGVKNMSDEPLARHVRLPADIVCPSCGARQTLDPVRLRAPVNPASQRRSEIRRIPRRDAETWRWLLRFRFRFT